MIGATLGGMKVQFSKTLTMDGEPYQKKRTWPERLFSKPWRPMVKTLTVVPQIPSDEIIIAPGHDTIIVHPETWPRIQRMINEHNKAFGTVYQPFQSHHSFGVPVK